MTPQTNISLSSPDEAVMSPPPSYDDDFKQFQDLMKWIADLLHIPLEEVQESQHKLLDILHMTSSSQVALLVNYSLLYPDKKTGQIPATAPHTCKQAIKNTMFLLIILNFYFHTLL